MSDDTDPDIETLRREGVLTFNHKNLSESRKSFESVLSRSPDDPISLLHLSLILQAGNEPTKALDLLKRSAALDPSYAVAKGSGVYLSRRLRVREGAAFEDGWISFLDVALLSGILPQPDLATLATLPPNPDDGTAIPRRILQFWDKPQPPGEVAMLMERCKDSNPDYEHALFCDADAEDFIATHYGVRHVDVYRGCFHVSAKADFFRLAYLYKLGGFYVDADEVCDKSLNPMFQTGGITEIYSFSRGLPSCVNNWFIGTVSGTRIVERALDHCIQNIESTLRHGRKSGVWVLTGPGALTFAILDIFCDPLEYMKSGNPFRNFVLLDEPEYRKLFSAPPMEYKSSQAGNWRLI